MESVKAQLAEITHHFNTKMADFQKELRGNIPATSPTSNINAQFGAFRTFVLTALENLQLQVELLARQHDELEMRTRKKILLVHGLAEADKEDLSLSVSKVLAEKLEVPRITSDAISRCHRLGQPRPSDGKPRAVLIKFRDQLLRDKVWGAKSKLKGSGVTLSEFLIKSRHKIFTAARERFGITKSWTQNGCIVIIDADGKRHRVFTMQELNAIPTSKQIVPGLVEASSSAGGKDTKATAQQRSKRTAAVKK